MVSIKKFYSYFRSSTAYRVRIALNIKQIQPEETVFINLKEGKQHEDSYIKTNPAAAVPAFMLDDGTILTQSLAMIEWLDEQVPQNPLLPGNYTQRQQIRSVAQDIACDIHPINNLRVLQYLSNTLSITGEAKLQWIQNWIKLEFAVLEKKLAASYGKYCFADNITLADICLIPQIYNAQRFDIDIKQYPTLEHINNNCLKLQEFIEAMPENQPDCNI